MVQSEKIEFLFKYVQNDVRQKLMLDEEALYSTTDQITADKITTDMLKFVPSSGIITDATACAGGNTYSFAQAYAHVNAFEKDVVRCDLLKHNLQVLGTSNVNVECGDAFNLCKLQYQDAVFIDPPWGGPDYKKHDKVDLYLSNTPLWRFCESVAGHTNYIAIKVPVNFNETRFLQDTAGFMEMLHKNTQLRKMYLYVFKVKRSTYF